MSLNKITKKWKSISLNKLITIMKHLFKLSLILNTTLIYYYIMYLTQWLHYFLLNLWKLNLFLITYIPNVNDFMNYKTNINNFFIQHLLLQHCYWNQKHKLLEHGRKHLMHMRYTRLRKFIHMDHLCKGRKQNQFYHKLVNIIWCI